MNTREYMFRLGKQARASSRIMARTSTNARNKALQEMATVLEARCATLIAANRKDIAAGQEQNLDEARLDRLTLSAEGISAMAEGVRQIAALPDPIGAITDLSYRPSGIQVGKMRVPLGVIGIIYESRPNVTADAAALCVKSGNAAILRGGSEANHSNRAIASCIYQALEQAGLPRNSVQLVEKTDRDAVGKLVTMHRYVDVVVPRGGKGLIERVSTEARVPVIKHLDGICHVYIDGEADIEKAMRVAFNSKDAPLRCLQWRWRLCWWRSQSPPHVLPELGRMYQEAGVEVRGCEITQHLIPTSTAARSVDWETEYLAPILSVRVVHDMYEAIEHIHLHGSGHTESIITENVTLARRFPH